MARNLPPGITEPHFTAAVEAFRRAVGDKWVLTGEDEVAGYRDPFPILDPGHFAPSAVVLPATVEEVQAVVEAADRHRVPLAPISRGKNLGFGGPAPRLPGAAVLDLKRMNRILDVDDRLGYAVVEPGVTFIDLAAYLHEHGSRFRVDVPDLGWGSVLGNTLERGMGYTPYSDHFATQCGMEVVLPDGDVVRTGMGALPGSRTAQVYPYGYGPSYDGMFTQSNFGVVTKMGLWLLPEPAGFRAYMITLPREEDLAPFTEILRPLRLDRTISHVPSMRSLLLDAAAQGPRSAYFSGDGPVPGSVQRRIMADQRIGMWNFYGALYGTEAAMDAQWSVIRDAFSAIPGAGFHFAGEHDSPVLAARAKIMAGRPNLETAGIFQWLDNAGHIDVAPMAPATGEDALRLYELARDLYLEFGKDYMGNFIFGEREMHQIHLMMFDTEDAGDRARTLRLCEALIGRAAEHGYGAYRAHPAIMDRVAATYGFNDNALLRLSERIKDALDPNGVLAPGKQGIWPRALRATGH
ncbi:FAD-binding oxidoreductase [Nocardiopsis sediminis]|uniref:FAD-binding oxidoreductase n=1 Tax=Nocardiopsis sediminis TaxID=1778267 RepID=A0ABV8FLG9_9ACTN